MPVVGPRGREPQTGLGRIMVVTSRRDVAVRGVQVTGGEVTRVTRHDTLVYAATGPSIAHPDRVARLARAHVRLVDVARRNELHGVGRRRRRHSLDARARGPLPRARLRAAHGLARHATRRAGSSRLGRMRTPTRCCCRPRATCCSPRARATPCATARACCTAACATIARRCSRAPR